MDVQFFDVDTLSVMVIYVFGEYEYYIRDMTDQTDVYDFGFGTGGTLFTQQDLEDRIDYLWECKRISQNL